MFKLIKVIAIACLLLQSVSSKAQTDTNFFYQKKNLTTLVTYNGFTNNRFNGSYLEIISRLTQKRQINGGIFIGGEAFASKLDFSFSDPFINNNGKTLVGGFGLVAGLLKGNNEIMGDARLSIGLSHVSQSSTFIYADIFQHIKIGQVQNDWLTYVETQLDITRNLSFFSFNRLILGLRYEQPIKSLTHVSINGREIIVSPSDRENIQFWLELAIRSFIIKNRWAITANLHGTYRHTSQNQQDLYRVGPVISIYNQYAEVIRLAYLEEINPSRNIPSVKNFMLTVDFINLGKGM